MTSPAEVSAATPVLTELYPRIQQFYAGQVRHLLEPICREGRLPGLGSEHEYRALLEAAGLVVGGAEDLTARVRRTWPVCLRRLAAGLLRDPTYRRFLLDRAHGDRVFLRGVDNAKFRLPVVPGDRLRLEVVLGKLLPYLAIGLCDVVVTVSAGMLIFGTPLKWVAMLAPLAFVFFFTFRIERMTTATARTTFFAFAATGGEHAVTCARERERGAAAEQEVAPLHGATRGSDEK